MAEIALNRVAARGFRQDHQTQIARALLGRDGPEYLDWSECLTVTGEALARQMDPFIFVFDDPADHLRAPAVPLQDRQGRSRVFL